MNTGRGQGDDEGSKDAWFTNLKKDIDKHLNINPKIRETFFYLKMNLQSMTVDDWNSIPDVDNSLINKRRIETLVEVQNENEKVSVVIDRKFFQNITRTNPSYPNAWIVLARLEESASNISVARHILSRGSNECPMSEDIWLEACGLAVDDKAVIRRALRALPTSQNLWIRAAEFEQKSFG